MDIALVRVDNRLVHGQILEAWVPYLHASCIVVVDDQVACDFFRETVIRMAVPREVAITICGIGEFAQNHAAGRGGKKTIVLFSSISDALTACRLGFMAGEFSVPDDFDQMGGGEIESLFAGRKA